MLAPVVACLTLPVAGPAAAADGPIVQAMYDSAHSTVIRAHMGFHLEAGVGWEAEQVGAQVATFDVRIARTSMTAASRSEWRYPTRLQHLAVVDAERHQGNLEVRKLLRLALVRGQNLCVSTRATDTLGNVSGWTPKLCVTRFLDEGSMHVRGAVKRLRNTHYWGGTATSIKPGGALEIRGVPQGSQVEVLGSTGTPTTGDGSVYIMGWLTNSYGKLGSAGWWHPAPRYHQRAWADRLTKRTGPVRLRPHLYTPKATVPIEGIAVIPPWA